MPTIQNLLKPTDGDRRLAFEYYLALCCEDDCKDAITIINGNAVQNQHGDWMYVITINEARKMYNEDYIKNEDPFIFGRDKDGAPVEWLVIIW